MSKRYEDPTMSVSDFFPTFNEKFQQNLQAAINSGAVSQEDMREQPYSVYRAVLIITAESYGPSQDNRPGLKMLMNLRHFI